MRKFSSIFLLTLAFIGVFSIGKCFASISEDQVSLGGISIGSSTEYVKSIYGYPDTEEVNYNHPLFTGRVDVYTYGNSFKITFADNQVVHIYTAANNGIGTPAGITVGMTSSTLTNVYGAADSIHNGNYFYHTSNNPYKGLLFITKNGKISSIACGYFD